MTALLLWRLLKWIALILWTSGMWAVVNSPSQRQRLQSLYALLLWGFAGTWLAGWGLMKALDLSMKEAWISQSMLMGLISLAAAFGASAGSNEVTAWPIAGPLIFIKTMPRRLATYSISVVFP